MKSTLLKIYIFSFLFVADFAAFAQPGTDDGTGGLEDDDPPPPAAPINTKLLLLLLFGILYAIYYFRKNKATT